jgi:hypothetical protein
MLARTGLTVREHQLRTVRNFLELQYLWSGPADSPFMPVLQGGPPTTTYLHCLNLYYAAGVDRTHYRSPRRDPQPRSRDAVARLRSRWAV